MSSDAGIHIPDEPASVHLDQADCSRATSGVGVLEDQEEEEELERARLRTMQLSHTIEDRKRYGLWAFPTLIGWLGTVAGLVFFSALELPLVGVVRFTVPTSVLVALTTSASVNVIGPFAIVLLGLYPRRGHGVA